MTHQSLICLLNPYDSTKQRTFYSAEFIPWEFRQGGNEKHLVRKRKETAKRQRLT
jgi:hypothetical protein